MRRRAHGQIRRGQIITTYGPGALIDMPRYSAIMSGLDRWPKPAALDEIQEPRLSSKLERMTGVPRPRLFAPPAASSDPREPNLGVGAWRFPEWFVVLEEGGGEKSERSRRLVNSRALDDKGKFDGRPVVATRFVRACPRGHVDDLDWYSFVHPPPDDDKPKARCRRQLWLDERGTSGDLIDLVVRCECGKRRPLYEATQMELIPLGTCRGARPWLGPNAHENCKLPSRLLIRTASNAYFSHVVSVLSLPDRGSAVEKAVKSAWSDLSIVETPEQLAFIKRKPDVAEALAGLDDAEVLKAIDRIRDGDEADRPLKQAELEALLDVPEGYGDDVPADPDFHARRLPEHAWRNSDVSDGIASVTQVHRLREVLTLSGFTRFEAPTPDIHGEYESDVQRAQLALDPSWFPAVENRGEGVFIHFDTEAIRSWLNKPGVKDRLVGLHGGHERWLEERRSKREFPGGAYILLHTLSHLLIQSLSMRCGYPASSIRERVYAEGPARGYGILLYTASPDAEGTLGGLVQQGRHFELHLAHALQMGSLCSNDPICAHHDPSRGVEGRLLLGAACHGCALVAETSCEMRNDYLDRALVVPALGESEAAFFSAP